MKTKTAVLLTVLLVAMYAGGLALATVITADAEALSAPPADVTAVEASPAVVVMPPVNFDLEASSPADLGGDGQADETSDVELPAPDLTWYDPHRLEAVCGIS